jgi:ornithine cyclodeaminase/alanine dehydrogenase-like protein (mu-crystallin family)
MTIVLQNHEIPGLMPLSGYISAVEDGYRDVGTGQGTNFPRENLWIPGDRDEAHGGGHLKEGTQGSVKFKAAALPEIGGAGVQAYTAGLPGGLDTYMFLFDTDDGSLAAITEVLYYDWIKTAATAAIATDHLAPEDSSVVGLFGTGRHARTQLHGLCAVRPVERVQAYSRRREPREEFCEQMSDELGIEVVPVDSPSAALKGVDIVTTITTSSEPVFDGAELPDRSIHINAMGAHYPWIREIDEDVVQRSRIVLDEWEQGLQEQGAILIPMEEGRLDASDLHGDLGDVVAGNVAGREPETERTLFLSGGTGVEDVAVATRLYEHAKNEGVGTEIFFNQPYDFDLDGLYNQC